MLHTLPTLLLAFGVAMQPAQVSAQPKAVGKGPSFTETLYGKMPESKDEKKKGGGEKITEYTLTNKNGMVVKCIEYGAIITEIHVPDKAGKFADVALGFGKLEDYLKGHPYFGTNAGRCANPHWHIWAPLRSLTPIAPTTKSPIPAKTIGRI